MSLLCFLFNLDDIFYLKEVGVDKNRKVGSIIIAASFSLTILCAVSSKWYDYKGYMYSFLNTAGYYLYESNEKCLLCNASNYDSETAKKLNSYGRVYYVFVAFKYLFFIFVSLALYGVLIFRGALNAPSFLGDIGGSHGSN